jgi:RNA polymerase sigma-70 factor, ECF subfamily
VTGDVRIDDGPVRAALPRGRHGRATGQARFTGSTRRRTSVTLVDSTGGTTPAETDEALVERLQAGDEQAFAELVRRYHVRLLRLARTFVRREAIAEEVVQDTWLAVVRGIDRFEGRSQFRTWLFGVLANRARTTGGREARTIAVDLTEPTVDPARFGADGTWIDPPDVWAERAEDRRFAAELAQRARNHLDSLPEQQRQVLVLRDVEALSAADTCTALGLSEGNQRVLLHRARARLRHLLAADLGKG